MPLSTLANGLFSSGFVVVGAYTLIIVAKLSLLRVIVMIMSLTCRGISVSCVMISFFIAKPSPASLLSPSGLPFQREREYSKSLRLPYSENLVSHRAAMSMLFLGSWQRNYFVKKQKQFNVCRS